MRHLWIVVVVGCLGCGSAETSAPPPQEPAPAPEPHPGPGDAPPPGDEPTQPGAGPGSGRMCGGIGGIRCPEGEWCDLAGTYPDASGTCRAQGTCTDAADCEGQGIVHIQCVGSWACESGRCSFECTPG